MAEPAGKGRPNRVRVATSSRTVELPWSSRSRLLDRISAGAIGVRYAFLAVGATRPVELTRADSAFLVRAIDEWERRAGPVGLPEGIWELRDALAEELTHLQ